MSFAADRRESRASLAAMAASPRAEPALAAGCAPLRSRSVCVVASAKACSIRPRHLRLKPGPGRCQPGGKVGDWRKTELVARQRNVAVGPDDRALAGRLIIHALAQTLADR